MGRVTDLARILRNAIAGSDPMRPYMSAPRSALLEIASVLEAQAPPPNPRLRKALEALEVAANTVVYCYAKRPENFAAALKQLQDDSEWARIVMNSENECPADPSPTNSNPPLPPTSNAAL